MVRNNDFAVTINGPEAGILTDSKDETNKGSFRIISGFLNEWVHLKLKLSLLGIIVKFYKNPLHWIGALQYLIQLRRQFLGDHRLRKMAYTDGRYFMGLYTPGWNSRVYKEFIVTQLHDYKPIANKINRLNTVLMAVTKKCPLQCEHCYEWDNLNKREKLSPDTLHGIVSKLQEHGVSQIQFSGGEPMLKVDTLVALIEKASDKTDFWVTTSGYKLTRENARRLKKAGLTGVIISLDHFVPGKHNAFRNYRDAFYWVEKGVANASKENLVVALSVCTTKEFISLENLGKYMALAKSWSVSFVQFLEPKAVGHFRGKNVAPTEGQIKILEDFYTQMNYTNSFKDYPIITYHGYYQRRQGCFSAGKKSIYVDTDGDINPCPFCPSKNGSVLDHDFGQKLDQLKQMGCSSY
nr:radical SAM protein [Allomuricauda sp.]